MRCPNCNHDIGDVVLTREMTAAGGRKSRRKLDSATAKAMSRKAVEARRRKREESAERRRK